MTAICSCQNCGQNIEFDESNSGQTVTCPHCGVETMLCAPKSKNQPPSPAAQTPNKPALTFKRDWLALVFQCTTAIAVIVCAVLIYKTTHQPASLPRWEYAAFEWNNDRINLNSGKGLITKIHIDTKYQYSYDERNFKIEDLLTKIGNYGWELVCFDGKHYIVKRSDEWANGGFYLLPDEWVDLPGSLSK